MKNIALFGVTVWLLADAIDAARKQATLATRPIHLRSYALFGSRRRINHPGEWMVGVMDSSPGLAAVSVPLEQNRAGLSARWRAPQLRSLRVVDRRAAVQPEPSRTEKE